MTRRTPKRVAEVLGGLPRLMHLDRPGMPSADRVIWTAATALMALGTVMVLSSSVMLAERKFGTPGFFWGRQLLWWALATAIMVTLSRVDHRRWRVMSPAIMLAALAALIVVLLVNPIKGVNRWIPVGPFNLQPAEVFRLAFIIYAAAFLAKRGEKIWSFRSWIPLVIVLAMGGLLLVLEPELSTVLTVSATGGVMLIAAGVRWRHWLPGAMVAIAAIVVVVYGFGYKTQRIADWERGLTVTDGSYQVRQSKMALGSGGLIGEGLGGGRAKMLYLPEPHTDFIIASVGEELGFVGFSVVMIALGLLIWRGWRVALVAPDRFGYLLCIGVGASLFINAGLNMAVATGLSPATGLPLPFVSYGGSSLLTTAAGWGIVLNVSRFARAGGWR